MSYCPFIKKECPKSHEDCEFWEDRVEHEKCTEGGCEGYGFDCDVCSCMKTWYTGGECSLKSKIRRRL